jgi:hypothetical protein
LPLVSSSQRDSKLWRTRLWRACALALVGAGAALVGGCHKIEAGYCEARLPPARVEIDAQPPAYILSTTATARYLGDQHGADGEMITYGLTSARSSVRAEVSLHVMRLPGAVCARPDLVVHLAYQPMTVEIAHELPPHSCAYETVLGHEKKHVDVFTQQLAKSSSALNAEIRQRGLDRPKIYPSVEAAERDMQGLQDDWLVPRGEQLLAEVADAQHAVDSVAEYHRVGSACPDSPLLSGQSAPGAFHF